MFQTQKNKLKFLLVTVYLATIMNDLSANTQANYAAGKLQPRDAELAIRKAIVAGGTINLLENQGQSRTRGVNDFDGDRLTNGRNVILDAITINYGTALAATLPQNVDYSTALPSALKTANLVIKQNGVTKATLSVASINAAKSSDEYYRFLEAFVLLREETTTSVELEFGAGTDLGADPGDSGFVEVIFRGFETYVKN